MPPSTATYVVARRRRLTRADAVERDAGAADERAARLEDQLRRGVAARRVAAAAATSAPTNSADRRHALVATCADAEAAAEVDTSRRPAELVAAARARTSASQSTASSARAGVEELRADVDVQAGDVEPGRARRARPPRARRPAAARTSSRGGRSGSPRACRPRCRASRGRARGATPAAARALDLVERVERRRARRPSAAARSSSSDLLLPWTTSRSPAIPAAQRELELAERRDVGAEALLGEQPQERDVRERLRPVDDERVRRGVAVRARRRAERLLAVDDERRAELVGELEARRRRRRELAAVDRARCPGRARAPRQVRRRRSSRDGDDLVAVAVRAPRRIRGSAATHRRAGCGPASRRERRRGARRRRRGRAVARARASRSPRPASVTPVDQPALPEDRRGRARASVLRARATRADVASRTAGASAAAPQPTARSIDAARAPIWSRRTSSVPLERRDDVVVAGDSRARAAPRPRAADDLRDARPRAWPTTKNVARAPRRGARPARRRRLGRRRRRSSARRPPPVRGPRVTRRSGQSLHQSCSIRRRPGRCSARRSREHRARRGRLDRAHRVLGQSHRVPLLQVVDLVLDPHARAAVDEDVAPPPAACACARTASRNFGAIRR